MCPDGTTRGLAPGVFDQRDDVLVYTGEVLPKDLEVTGQITMKLHASSSALDTDFTAKLLKLIATLLRS
jgi:predicted acyl esterase